MRELFIYYQIPVTQAVAARAQVDAFQARLRQRHPGLVTRLLRRPEPRDSQQTWMEIYSFDRAVSTQGISPALQAEIEAEASCLADTVHGTRHTEVFIACVS